MPDPRARDPRFPNRPTHPDFIRLSETVQNHDAMAEQVGVNPMAILGVDEKSFMYFLENRIGIMAQRLGTRVLLAKAQVGAIYMDAFALGKRFAEQVTEDVTTLPEPARKVLDECIAEAWRNTESGDDEAHTEADVAADIVEQMYRIYRVRSHDDGLDNNEKEG